MKSDFIEYRKKNYRIDGDAIYARGVEYAKKNPELMKRLANL